MKSIDDIISYLEDEISRYRELYYKYSKRMRCTTNQELYTYYDSLCSTYYCIIVKDEKLLDFIKTDF